MSNCNQYYSYFEGITAFFESSDVAMEFLKSHSVIAVNVKCSECHKDCNYREDQEL